MKDGGHTYFWVFFKWFIRYEFKITAFLILNSMFIGIVVYFNLRWIPALFIPAITTIIAIILGVYMLYNKLSFAEEDEEDESYE